MPINNPAVTAEASEGTYVGNNTANRAIPHGLSGTPKVAIITSTIQLFASGILSAGYQYALTDARTALAVTSPDSTNFYVSFSAASTAADFNVNGLTYKWKAFT